MPGLTDSVVKIEISRQIAEKNSHGHLKLIEIDGDGHSLESTTSKVRVIPTFLMETDVQHVGVLLTYIQIQLLYMKSIII